MILVENMADSVLIHFVRIFPADFFVYSDTHEAKWLKKRMSEMYGLKNKIVHKCISELTCDSSQRWFLLAEMCSLDESMSC